jgi:hypothetical protein
MNDKRTSASRLCIDQSDRLIQLRFGTDINVSGHDNPPKG